MAVYTEVSDGELSAFIADYDLGTLLSFRGIAEGVENTNYIVHTDQAQFILTLYEKRVDPDDLPFFLALLDHLKGTGLAVPAPVHDRSGEALRTLSGRPAALFTFLEGLWVRRPKVQHCSALGRALAEFHLKSEGFALERKNALSVESWAPLATDCGAGADDLEAGLSIALTEEAAELGKLWPDGLPKGVIHADLFPDNVFFIGDEISGFIDFYFACTDAFAYDLAICLNAWCFEPDHDFNVTKGRALLAGYESVRPLSGAERDALPLLARGSAFRFLLTRLYDWVNTPEGALVKPKDPTEYLKKHRFHKAVGRISEYGL